MGRIGAATLSDYVKAWQDYKDNFAKAMPIPQESRPQKLSRIKRLESNPEQWFAYYYEPYYTSEPAEFHLKGSARIIQNNEWYEVRAWSRELAKSARSMMEFTYLAMIGKLRNILLVSNSGDNAERLLLPFKAFFETNARLINDYGPQVKSGSWKSYEFSIRKGCTFRALGWGESPRGTRKDQVRPDGILIDDIDTDEDCRNEDTMNNKVNWIEQALLATRSISNPTRVLVNGNIIHNNCAVLRLSVKADYFDVVNIRDKDGKSTWPQKNKEHMIDRVLSMISYESGQKEYFNNPMDGTDTFKNLIDSKIPNLKSCAVTIYADPATSNKDITSGSHKAIWIIAKKGFDYYIVKGYLDTMSNARFVDALFECYLFLLAKGIEVKVHIENNKLQDPFYEQVFLPMIYARGKELKTFLPITPDTRDKPEKYSRIEGTLEPINRLGHLHFNIEEKDNPHMMRLKAQFSNFSRKQKRMDGPDCIEGGVHKLKNEEAVDASGLYESVKRKNSKRF
ncbi:MAG: hypothetical protein RBS07_15830 [Lentimicrobium sp.]|jgi:hypothetical protein|nr:hypothetical protein [Lentimicrobium sp.]